VTFYLKSLRYIVSEKNLTVFIYVLSLSDMIHFCQVMAETYYTEF